MLILPSGKSPEQVACRSSDQVQIDAVSRFAGHLVASTTRANRADRCRRPSRTVGPVPSDEDRHVRAPVGAAPSVAAGADIQGRCRIHSESAAADRSSPRTCRIGQPGRHCPGAGRGRPEWSCGPIDPIPGSALPRFAALFVHAGRPGHGAVHATSRGRRTDRRRVAGGTAGRQRNCRLPDARHLGRPGPARS